MCKRWDTPKFFDIMLIQYLINVEPVCVAYSPRPDEVLIVRYVQPLTDEQHQFLDKIMKEDTAFGPPAAIGGKFTVRASIT